jgi:hypothetical protein
VHETKSEFWLLTHHKQESGPIHDDQFGAILNSRGSRRSWRVIHQSHFTKEITGIQNGERDLLSLVPSNRKHYLPLVNEIHFIAGASLLKDYLGFPVPGFG